jgi:glycosyltransferase involved in cell wall biosynthesis
MEAPLISVIIPTYNRKAALAELLESLVRQTYSSFEVIIVNDYGEPVDEVIALYPELDIHSITTVANLKHVYARNLGLSLARGEYIMLCDDDDLLLPGHMERMLEALTGYDLVYSDVEIVKYNWNEDRTVRIPEQRRLFAYRFELEGMREFSTFVSSGCLYRKQIHEELGEFDTAIFHYWDWDFILRVAERYRIHRIPVASAIYAFSSEGDNMSANTVDMCSYLDKLCDKHGLGELPTKNFFLLLEEEGVKKREAESSVVWDGQPIISRWAKLKESN